jgi:ABC-2 type transport system permease protein/ribosome-dependent ATPase
MNGRRIFALALKEWRETVRDRLFLLLAFLLPVLWMLVFGYGLVLDVEHVRVALLDHDRTDVSRDYLSRFVDSRYFDVRGYLNSEREADALLQTAAVRGVIIVPERFAERLRSGQPVAVQTLLDGTFPLHTDITRGYVVAINAAFSADRVDQWLRASGVGAARARELAQPLGLQVRYLYNEEVRGTWSQVPALLMFTLMLASPLLTALAIVREKESGSIYNLFSSPVTRMELIIGKLLPYLGIATVNALMLWAMAVWLFDVPFKGSFVLFLVGSVLFVMVTTGIGLVVSLLVRTQMAALIVTMVISTVPTFLFSGLLVPVSSLERGAQIQAHLFPSMYFTDILRGSFLKGVGWDVLWPQLFALVIFAVVLRVGGYWLFRKRPPV